MNLNDLEIFDQDELLAIATIAFDKQDLMTALPILKKLVTSEQCPVGSFSLLGRIYAILGLYERAMIAFNAYLEHRPEVVPEHFEIGLLHRELGNDNEALKVWDEVLEKAPGFPPALYSKAVYLRDYNLIDDALDLLNTLIETAPPEDRHVEMANQLISEISLQS